MTHTFERFIKAAPDPNTAANRIDRLCKESDAGLRISKLDDVLQKDLIAIISLSNFLFHFVLRHPDVIGLIGHTPRADDREISKIGGMDELRLYKYRELLKITWMDMSGLCDYRVILTDLSRLAIDILRRTMKLSVSRDDYTTVIQSSCVIALGKLGANELNFSSDIDLIFVTVNPDKSISEYQELQKLLINFIRTLNHTLEEKTVEGFLYRVDQKLRPWGASGPLCMAIDDTEHYYEASSEPWERFAWSRARLIAGSENLGNDLLDRMQPFVYRRSLGMDDLDKFVEIKQDMSRARKRPGKWDVKTGEGGIRDIEFFIQMLQIVNAAGYNELKTTSTIKAMSGLRETGLISTTEESELYESYIFLRRLENRLQMIDELQTHDLSDDRAKRLVLARSLVRHADSDDQILNEFEEQLITHRSIAKKYFERVLPGENAG